ncbi:MAG TPA: SprT-like domain-containing protein [Prevotella sp.]
MQASLEWMEQWFAVFNREYFGGSLPLPRMRVSHSRTRLGSMSCKRRTVFGRSKYSDYALHLSDYYDLTERELQNVLLHEMIHYSIAYTGVRDSSPHGTVFRGMMEALNSRYGWDIRISTPMRGKQSATMRPRKPKQFLVLAMALNDGRQMLSVVNPRYAAALNQQLRTVIGLKHHGWYTTQDDYFFGFPQVRSLRGKLVAPDFYADKIKAMTPFVV